MRKQHLEHLQDTLHKAYLELLEKDITKAFIYSYKEQAETLFQNYLDHAEAYVTKSKVRDPNTREELQPDEAFLKSIEEQIAIIGSAADGFRQEVIAYLWASSRRGEKITYSAYEPLKEAIERKLMNSVRELSRIITKARTRDETSVELASEVECMAKQTIDFAKLIQEDRETRQQQHWQGTFLEYLEKVKADPALANLSHRRLYDMIDSSGVTEINPENEPRIQRLFGDEPIKV